MECSRLMFYIEIIIYMSCINKKFKRLYSIYYTICPIDKKRKVIFNISFRLYI